MSFKDFVAFCLRMSGFGLVISTLVGISGASFLIVDGVRFGSFGDQVPLILMSVLMPIIIGLVLAFMPYKISNFFIVNNQEINNSPEFCALLTRVGLALLGIYIVVTGLQFLVHNIIMYLSYPIEYVGEFEGMFNRRELLSSIVSQVLRIVSGVVLILGSKLISTKLGQAWFKAKRI